jgi:hypothetical protein
MPMTNNDNAVTNQDNANGHRCEWGSRDSVYHKVLSALQSSMANPIDNSGSTTNNSKQIRPNPIRSTNNNNNTNTTNKNNNNTTLTVDKYVTATRVLSVGVGRASERERARERERWMECDADEEDATHNKKEEAKRGKWQKYDKSRVGK